MQNNGTSLPLENININNNNNLVSSVNDQNRRILNFKITGVKRKLDNSSNNNENGNIISKKFVGSNNVNNPAPNSIIDIGNEDIEEEYEEEYIVFDLPTHFDKIPSEYAVIGLETDTPFLQFGKTIFRGKHEETVCSSIIFKNEENNIELSNKTNPTYISHTNKMIKFEQVELVKKFNNS
eukprot:TRINITY_DN8992_c0_g1_i2.p1 TRINITY_DN8992_c0_g1~~TRINITY_DN8992_c0_g1_i2.p1  ORF type:complete len:180 (-),score=61.71 TRINITY_DN8992_c0_g1_i2:140-679(-)